MLLPLIATAKEKRDDSELIETVDNLRIKVDNESKYSKEVQSVYEAMSKMESVKVEIPSIDYKKAQDTFMPLFELPQPDNIVISRDANDEASCIDPATLGNFNIYILISESVPMKTLETYMRDAYRMNDTLLVLRGLVGNDISYIMPTANFMTELSCGKKANELVIDDPCEVSRVDINPLLYSAFSVEKVPAIVFSKLSYHELMMRMNLGEKVADDEFYMIKGDISLEYALEQFLKIDPSIKPYLERLRGSYYEG